VAVTGEYAHYVLELPALGGPLKAARFSDDVGCLAPRCSSR
jgi:hypothetical protein